MQVTRRVKKRVSDFSGAISFPCVITMSNQAIQSLDLVEINDYQREDTVIVKAN